jgi:multidrug resistance efflux pump
MEFTEDQEVKDGDRLVQIDPRPYQALLDVWPMATTTEPARGKLTLIDNAIE